MPEHKMTRIFGGQMESGWIQPVCSCGWEGRKEYAYNDYQHSNVREQEVEHIRSSVSGFKVSVGQEGKGDEH